MSTQPASNSTNEVCLKHVPQALRELRQWVAWKPVPRGDKISKVPVTPRGLPASTIDPTTWSTFDEVVATEPRIGFVFTETDPFCGIDLDGCRDPATGTISGEALSIVASLGTYTEISQSGRGLHCICKATLGKGRRVGAVEIYDRARYFCMSGQIITPAKIEARQDVIDRLAGVGLGKVRCRVVPDNTHPVLLSSPQADAELLTILLKDFHFEGFHTYGAAGYVTPDWSRLLFWCARIIARHTADPDQIERVLMQTALFAQAERARPKWSSRRGDTTWGKQLITEVVGRCV